jgi:hypothetical protein
MKTYVGIDPGKSGAIVTIFNEDIQKFTIPKIGKEVDAHQLNNLLKSLNNLPYPHHIILEDVHAIFGSAAGATFSFGWIVGVIEGILVANNLSFTKVQPKVWQKEMFQGIPEQRKPSSVNKKGVTVKGKLDTKAMSIMASKRLFPGFSLLPSERCKNPDDGISDALLMAEYCRRKHK